MGFGFTMLFHKYGSSAIYMSAHKKTLSIDIAEIDIADTSAACIWPGNRMGVQLPHGGAESLNAKSVQAMSLSSKAHTRRVTNGSH